MAPFLSSRFRFSQSPFNPIILLTTCINYTYNKRLHVLDDLLFALQCYFDRHISQCVSSVLCSPFSNSSLSFKTYLISFFQATLFNQTSPFQHTSCSRLSACSPPFCLDSATKTVYRWSRHRCENTFQCISSCGLHLNITLLS